jgi:hypothetical protein
MSSASFDDAGAVPLSVASAAGVPALGPWRPWLALAAASAAWFAVAALTQLWPDRPESDWPYTSTFAVILGALAPGLRRRPSQAVGSDRCRGCGIWRRGFWCSPCSSSSGNS